MNEFKRFKEWLAESGQDKGRDRTAFLIQRKAVIDSLIKSVNAPPEEELISMLETLAGAIGCIVSLGVDPEQAWQIFMDFKFRQIQMGRSSDPRIALKRLMVESEIYSE